MPRNLSAIMPVHNEQHLLPYSLASLTHAPIDELCILLDRCTDHSRHIIERWIKTSNPQYAVKLQDNWESTWTSHIAEVATKAFDMATGDIIYGLAADIIFPTQFFNAALFDTVDITYFAYFNWDLQRFAFWNAYLWILEQLYARFETPALPTRMGIFAVKREVWNTIRFRDIVFDATRAVPILDYEQDFILRLRKAGYREQLIQANVMQLRYRPGQDLVRAIARKKLGTPFYRVLLHSILHLRPQVIADYMRLHGR